MGMAWAEKLKAAEVYATPFPHLVIDDFLPDDLLTLAVQGFPDLGLIGALTSRSIDVKANSRASLDLATVQKSGDARLEALKTFYQALGVEALVSAIFAKLRPLLDHPLDGEAEGLPYLPRMSEGDIQNWLQGRPSLSFDIQPGINPPQYAGLAPHLDDKFEIFAGLLYVYPDQSAPVGGDLVLYARCPEAVLDGAQPKGAFEGTPIKRIAYRHNRFVVLLNGKSAWHGVTPYLESDNKLPRRLYNIILESYNLNYRCYGYRDVHCGTPFTSLKHAVKGGTLLALHRLQMLFKPSMVARKLKDYTPGEVMDRWEFWA
jgi:hypothetical protein